MVKELLINGEVNRFTTTNRARQAIAFQYVTQTKTLRLLDTYTNTSVNLIANGDNALTSSAIEYIWTQIQDRVQGKVAGAFKFRGNVDSLDDITNPQPGDVYQVTLSTGQYDPNTGQLIPSTVQYNDKEYAWAEKTDPNTGLPIGGQWVELGFNFTPEQGTVTKQWIEEYMQTKQQAQAEHEAISTYVDTVSGNIKAYINITAQNLSTYVDETAAGLSTYVDESVSNLSTNFNDAINEVYNYIDNTVSTSIIYYVNGMISQLSTAIDNLTQYVDAQDTEINNRINELSAAVDAGNGQMRQYVDDSITNLSGDVYNTINNMSGAVDVKFDNARNQHILDLTFYEYDNEGNLINHDRVLPITPVEPAP